jgi:hypothetical protein
MSQQFLKFSDAAAGLDRVSNAINFNFQFPTIPSQGFLDLRKY